jgi:hypothetical protein
MNELRG